MLALRLSARDPIRTWLHQWLKRRRSQREVGGERQLWLTAIPSSGAAISELTLFVALAMSAVACRLQMTQAIVEAARPFAIAVHDHIIVGKDGHASFKALKLL
jgi:RadC-like JAB domain